MYSLFFKYIRSFALIGASICAISCGGGQSEPLAPRAIPDIRGESSLATPPIENIQAPITQLERAEVVRVVDAGFGRFLQYFTTEASLDHEGNFVGFRIVSVENRKFFEGLGIGAGDIVTRVNGGTIERPAQAHAAFVRLKTAPRLDVEYLRGGRTMRLSLPIVGSLPGEADKKLPN